MSHKIWLIRILSNDRVECSLRFRSAAESIIEKSKSELCFGRQGTIAAKLLHNSLVETNGFLNIANRALFDQCLLKQIVTTLLG